MKGVIENGYLMVEHLHELTGSAQINMRRALKGIGSIGEFMQISSDRSQCLEDFQQAVLELGRNEGLFGDIGQGGVTDKWSQTAIELLRRMRELEVLLGIEVASDAVGVGSMHRKRDKRDAARHVGLQTTPHDGIYRQPAYHQQKITAFRHPQAKNAGHLRRAIGAAHRARLQILTLAEKPINLQLILGALEK